MVVRAVKFGGKDYAVAEQRGEENANGDYRSVSGYRRGWDTFTSAFTGKGRRHAMAVDGNRDLIVLHADISNIISHLLL